MKRVFNIYAVPMLKWGEERKDLYQEILIQIWHSLPSFKGDAKLSTWIYRLAVNTAISFVRKKESRKKYYAAYKKEKESREGYTYRSDDPPGEQEQVRALYQAISTLNSSDKVIISMYLGEFSYADIAYVTGITENYVGVRLNRIKKKLSKILEH